MTCRVSHTSIDCHDAFALSEWWKETLDYVDVEGDPTEGTRDEEVARLCGRGATQVADHRGIHGPGTGWVVLADPEGNEFCVLRGEAERG